MSTRSSRAPEPSGCAGGFRSPDATGSSPTSHRRTPGRRFCRRPYRSTAMPAPAPKSIVPGTTRASFAWPEEGMPVGRTLTVAAMLTDADGRPVRDHRARSRAVARGDGSPDSRPSGRRDFRPRPSRRPRARRWPRGPNSVSRAPAEAGALQGLAAIPADGTGRDDRAGGRGDPQSVARPQGRPPTSSRSGRPGRRALSPRPTRPPPSGPPDRGRRRRPRAWPRRRPACRRA